MNALRLVGAATAAAVMAGALVSAPMAAAEDDTRAELRAYAAATSAANATGYQYTVTNPWTTYSVGAVGSNLDTAQPNITAAWISDPRGILESLVSSEFGGTAYQNYGYWKEGDGGDLSQKVTRIVDRAVDQEGGNESSLIVAGEYDTEQWPDVISQAYDAEPGQTVSVAIDRLDLFDPEVQVTKIQDGDTTVFAYTLGDDPVRIVVSADGLIESFSGPVLWLEPRATLTMEARGDAATPPDNISDALVTRAPVQAIAYDRTKSWFTLAMEEVSTKAQAVAKRQGTRVTKAVIERAYKKLRMEYRSTFGTAPIRVTSVSRGFKFAANNSADYPMFGKVCATVKAGKTKPRVTFCPSP